MTLMMTITLLLFTPIFFKDLGFNMFARLSRNYYNVTLFMANFVYNKSYWQDKKQVPILPTMLSLFITILSGSRAGIITYFVFALAVILKNIKIMKMEFRGVNKADKIFKDVSLEDTKEIPVIDEKFLAEIKENDKLACSKEKRRKGKKEKEEQEQEEGKCINSKKNNDNKLILFLKYYRNNILSFIALVLFFTLIFGLKYVDKKYGIIKTSFWGSQLQKTMSVIEDNVTDASYGFQEKGLTSKVRLTMIKKYIGYMSTDINDLVNGVKLGKEPFFAKYGNNLHNSYLLLHSRFGILGFALLAYLCFKALINLIRQKEWEDILIYLAILARVFVDMAAFPGPLDIIIFYYVFKKYNLVNKKKE